MVGAMKVVAICGSLRKVSVNLAFCRAAVQLAPANVHVSIFAGLGNLPLFNPDLETTLPAVVCSFRESVGSADALLIASPEYAHGISGPMKNALDWLVSFEGTAGKPVALVNTSPRAHHAYDSLHEVLTTMSTVVVPQASLIVPLPGAVATEQAMTDSPEVQAIIQRLFVGLADYLSARAADA